MPGIRRRLRDELVSRLTGIDAVAADPVKSLSEVLWEEQLPRVAVWIPSDTEGEDSSKDDIHHQVEIQIAIAGKKQGGSTAIDLIETIAEEVESRLLIDFEGNEFEWQSIAYADEQDGQQPFPSATITYLYEYNAPPGTS